MNSAVKIWEEEIILPTYGIGKPEKSPMFLEKRVYQGSSGVVYPYPVIEKIEDSCKDCPYKAIFMENEYIKIMILPELGGRVQMAYDKIKDRHFIYYNHVIKPALVGLAGPWISGGIEFNWPQHHRPSTFLPVDYAIENRPDGSAAIWISERERMFHQKATTAFILRPGKAVLEIQGAVSNPTPMPQTFLWWANPAVAVNDFYQSVFPADVNAVFDHGKRDVSKYPIATGTYYKMDYSAGVDISRYKNIPVPTSYMAIKSKYDFVGGYENDTHAGLLHVADHHISPGKKQWTWGNGDFGKAWDRNLTDNDGPYIELMTGVYTDNQPDFTWLQPYEEKTFTQYFMPYRELGVVKNASSDILMNIEPDAEGTSDLKIFATSILKGIHIVVNKSGKAVFETITNLSPEEVFVRKIGLTDLRLSEVLIYDSSGRLMLMWKPEAEDIKEMPEPAKAAMAPREIMTTEQLYLTGLHLEQYRHATYSPIDYYKEALRRDESDIRNNNAMGLWLIRKGKFAEAEPYLRRAIKTLTEKNPNPYDGEALYNLGLSLKYQGKIDEAYDFFYKSCWNAAWQDAGYFSLAQISSSKRNWENALYEIDRALVRNWHNLRARHLKAAILRHLGQTNNAAKWIEDSLQIDRFNFGCEFERFLQTQGITILNELAVKMRTDSHNYEELALDYASAGCFHEALSVAEWAISTLQSDTRMLHYYKAWFLCMIGDMNKAKDTVTIAETLPEDTFFPNTLESITALQCVTKLGIPAPKAYYLLGNIWYDKRQYNEAITAWEKSAALDDSFPIVLRNLSLAYFNKLGKVNEALTLLEKAFALDTTDARMLMELDQLRKRLNHRHSDRRMFLEKYSDTTAKRDDLYLEYITLLNQCGEYEKALEYISSRRFHPWEGGEGKVPAQYQTAHLQLAKKYLTASQYDKALEHINQCYIYPENLGEGKLHGARENDFDYYKGCILQAMGHNHEAKKYFHEASSGDIAPTAAMYYNDQKPDKIYYQGLALRKLGREKEALGCFNRLIDYAEKHIFDTFKMDYFAVSLPDLQIWEDDMNKRNVIHCRYLLALGYSGLGKTDQAGTEFANVLKMDNNHPGMFVSRSE